MGSDKKNTVIIRVFVFNENLMLNKLVLTYVSASKGEISSKQII